MAAAWLLTAQLAALLGAASGPLRLAPQPAAASPLLSLEAPPRRRSCVQFTTATAAEPGTAASGPYTEDQPSPPIQNEAETVTLELLEWSRLSRQVGTLASTPQGRARISAGLELPKTRAESEKLLAETSEAYFLEQMMARPIELRGFGDIAPLVSLAGKGGVLDGRELAAISTSLATAAALVRRFREVQAECPPEERRLQLLPGLFEDIPVQAELRLRINEVVDESGEVRDTAAESLGEIRFAFRELATATKRELTAIMQKRSDALVTRTITRRSERFVLQVPAKQRHRVPGVVRDVSSTGSTLLIEPKEVEAANTKLRQLAKREAAIVKAVLKALSQRIGSPKVERELQLLADATLRVDLAAARARYAAKVQATPVTFATSVRSEGLELNQLLHPLLVWRNEGIAPNASEVVPQDYTLNASKRVAVITGPNTGGKTVALKTLGLAALMARAGLWVISSAAARPQQGSGLPAPLTIPYFDRVFADIGDDQSIVQSLSTFSAHVARVRCILDHVTSDSLVLLDEVGAGTDPTEGSALGSAVLRRLASSASLTLCTTHHGSLKTLKYKDPRFENACVEFDDDKLAPTYRLLWGIPGRSNAIAIARRLGMQLEVVDEADALLADGEMDVGQVVAAMQEEQEEQRTLSAQLSALRDEAAAARDALVVSTKEQVAREQALLAEQRAALEAELAAAKDQIRTLLEEVRDTATASTAPRQASLSRHKLSLIGKKGLGAKLATSNRAASPASSKPPPVEDVAVGDYVRVPRLGGSPVQVEDRKGKQLFVAFGGLRMKVKLSEVTEVKKAVVAPQQSQPQRSPRSPQGTSKVKARTAVRLDSNTLDLRGARVAEVGDDIARAVDKALELGTLYIIHGRGTGSLRKHVRGILEDEPMVERFEDAPEAEGGNGCTIAYLR